MGLCALLQKTTQLPTFVQILNNMLALWLYLISYSYNLLTSFILIFKVESSSSCLICIAGVYLHSFQFVLVSVISFVFSISCSMTIPSLFLCPRPCPCSVVCLLWSWLIQLVLSCCSFRYLRVPATSGRFVWWSLSLFLGLWFVIRSV